MFDISTTKNNILFFGSELSERPRNAATMQEVAIVSRQGGTAEPSKSFSHFGTNF
mgnify:CR=1 FL=1